MMSTDGQMRSGLELFGSPVQDGGIHRAQDLAWGSKVGRKECDQIHCKDGKASCRKDEKQGPPKHQGESSRSVAPKELTPH